MKHCGLAVRVSPRVLKVMRSNFTEVSRFFILLIIINFGCGMLFHLASTFVAIFLCMFYGESCVPHPIGEFRRIPVYSASHYICVAPLCTLHPTAPPERPSLIFTFGVFRCTLHRTTHSVHRQVHSALPYTSVAPRCTVHLTAPPECPSLIFTFGALRCTLHLTTPALHLRT